MRFLLRVFFLFELFQFCFTDIFYNFFVYLQLRMTFKKLNKERIIPDLKYYSCKTLMFFFCDKDIVSSCKFIFFLLFFLLCSKTLSFWSWFKDENIIKSRLFVFPDAFLFGKSHRLKHCSSKGLNRSFFIILGLKVLSQFSLFELSRHLF